MGLDPDALRQLLQVRARQAKVEAEIDEAGVLHIHVVPNFVFDGLWIVKSAQPYAILQRVMLDYVQAPRK